MNADIERTENPLVPYRVVSHCRSYAEAVHKQKLVCKVDPLAFLPTYGAGIAIADGFPATGAFTATHVDESAPELTPAQAAMLELADEDAPIASLKAGEAT